MNVRPIEARRAARRPRSRPASASKLAPICSIVAARWSMSEVRPFIIASRALASHARSLRRIAWSDERATLSLSLARTSASQLAPNALTSVLVCGNVARILP